MAASNARDVLRQEVHQDVCLTLILQRQEVYSLVSFAFIRPWLIKFSTVLWESQVWTWPEFNIICFKFGSKIMIVVLFSPSGITDLLLGVIQKKNKCFDLILIDLQSSFTMMNKLIDFFLCYPLSCKPEPNPD